MPCPLAKHQIPSVTYEGSSATVVHRKRGAFVLSLFAVAVAMLAGGATAPAGTTGAHMSNHTGEALTLHEVRTYSSEAGAHIWASGDPSVIPPRKNRIPAARGRATSRPTTNS